jgi:uncharacterized caspase-like protein
MRARHPRSPPIARPVLWILGLLLSASPAHAAAADAPAAAPATASEPRLALVIGNGGYHHVPPLTNPPNDARLAADTLRSLGFRLVGDAALVNADHAAMEHAIRDFGKRLRGGAVGLFYYAGHGVQIEGENYLVPVGADVEDAADVKYELVNVGYVLDEMKNAANRLNIVILDACRNNPFGGRGLRALSRGLAQMQAPEGTLISYATQPGNTASDGNGKNSPFTKALTAAMMKPGLGVFDTFNEVGLTVKAATGGQQQPWLASSPIEGTFQFRAGSAAPVPAPPSAPVANAAAAAASAADERSYWESVRDSKNPAELEAYLKRFPQGTYAELARTRLASLKAVAATNATTHRTAATGAGAAGSAADDRAYWESVRETRNPAEVEAYLQRFPQGTYADLAKARLVSLKEAPPPTPAAQLIYPQTPPLHFGASYLQAKVTAANRVGSKEYAPLPESANVVVYSSEGEAKRSYEVVATLAHSDPCTFHRCTVENAIEPLSAKAREVGANGIIIDSSQTVRTSLVSTGVVVHARAIRLAEK